MVRDVARSFFKQLGQYTISGSGRNKNEEDCSNLRVLEERAEVWVEEVSNKEESWNPDTHGVIPALADADDVSSIL